MYTPLIDRQNVLARQNEILSAVERSRLSQKSSKQRTFRWFKLSSLFIRQKPRKQTAGIPQSQ